MRRIVTTALVVMLAVVLVPQARAETTACASLSAYSDTDLGTLGLTREDCVPKAVGQSDADAVRAWLLTPGDTRTWLVAPATSRVVDLTRVAVGTVPAVAGTVSAAATGLAGAAMAGITLAVGGVLGWVWSPDDDLASVPVAPTGSGYLWQVVPRSGYASTAAALTGVSVTGTPVYVNNGGTYGWQFPSGSEWSSPGNPGYLGLVTASCADPGQSPLSAGGDPSTLAGFRTSVPGALGWLGSSFSQTSAAPAMPSTICAGPGDHGDVPYRLGFALKPSSGSSTVWADVFVYPQSVGSPAPGSALPGRVIEQTVTCRRPNGTTYTYSSSTDISAALSPTSTVGVAGLMCDPGDRATDASAVLAAPGQTDVPLTSTAPSFSPSRAPSTGTLPACAALPSGCLLVNPAPTPEPPGVITPAPPLGTPPGTETEDGTAFCGMTFGDVLNGSIMFKAVGCALSWAFVPSPSAVPTATATLTEAWDASAVGTFVTAGASSIGSIGSLFTGSTGCGGIPFSVPLLGHDSETVLLDSCEPTVAEMASSVRLLLTVVIAIGGVLLLVNTLLGAFGLPRMWSRGGAVDGD